MIVQLTVVVKILFHFENNSFIHPLRDSIPIYLFRLGGTFNHIKTENNDGAIIVYSRY